MPFENRSVMQQKLDFVYLAQVNNLSFSELCKRFNISRPTGYKWIYRFKTLGTEGLQEQSRKAASCPHKTPDLVEELIVQLRNQDPAWGPKKIRQLLLRKQARGEYLFAKVPATSTIGSILKRRDLINAEKSQKAKPFKSFEYDQPNDLWQMDYKGEFQMLDNSVCHPLTVTDDYSRFNLVLSACHN
jgi:transposase